MGEVPALSDKPKAEIKQMIEKHEDILAALNLLSNEATKVGKLEYAVHRRLMLQAQAEEEVALSCGYTRVRVLAA
jgi:hypothetical protein